MNRNLKVAAGLSASLVILSCSERFGDPIRGTGADASATDASTTSDGRVEVDMTSRPDAPAAVALSATLPKLCTADGWCGADLTFSAVWGPSANDVWAVAKGLGDNPTISAVMRWNGTAWTTVIGLTDVPAVSQLYDLQAVGGTASDDVWLAGSFGTCLHWNGTAWTDFNVPYAAIKGLWAIARDDVWAVGDAGLILHWNGTAWEHRSFPNNSGQITTANLKAIWGRGANDVWAVGDRGTIVHWDGATLRRSEDALGGTPTTADLRAVWGRTANDVWAVGTEGTVMRWNGTAWSLSSQRVPTSKDLNAVWGWGASDVWIAGVEGTLLHFTDDAWYTIAGKTTETLLSLWGSGGGELWAVGERSAAVYWDRTAWSATAPRPVQNDLLAVWARRTDDVWIAGTDGVIARWDGTAWSRTTTGDGAINAIWAGSGDGPVYMAGDAGKALLCIPQSNRATMGCWSSATPSDPDFKAVWGFNDADVWFGGLGGTLRHWDGQTLTAVASPVTANVMSFWGDAPNDLWAATDSDKILHWNGTDWSATSVVGSGNTGTSWRLVTGTSPRDVWLSGRTCFAAYKAGGCFSVYGRWDGTAWSVSVAAAEATPALVSEPTFNTSAWSGGVSDLWTVSPGPSAGSVLNPQDARPIMHWNGARWSRSWSGSRLPLYAISGRDDDLWAVGAQGTIVHRHSGPKLVSSLRR